MTLVHPFLTPECLFAEDQVDSINGIPKSGYAYPIEDTQHMCLRSQQELGPPHRR